MRKKGLFSLLEDCDQQEHHPKEMEPVHQYKSKNGESDVLLTKPKSGQPQAKRNNVKADHYDDNGTISLTYVNGSYRLQPDEPAPFTQQQSYHDYPLTEDQDYYVEPFETPTSSEMMIAFKNPGQAPAPASPQKKYPSGSPDQAVTPAYPSEVGDKKKPSSTEQHAPVLPASEEDAAFAEDIQAILSGKKTYDQFQKKMVPAEEVSIQQPKPANKPEAKEFADEHAIFDKIAQSMQLATSYDLGSIDLDQRFDHFDKEIEKKEEAIQVPKKATDSLADQQISPKSKPEEPLKKEAIPPVETVDFLKDLDKMKQVKQMASVFSKSPQGPLTDPNISQFPIIDSKKPQEPLDENIPNKPKPKAPTSPHRDPNISQFPIIDPKKPQDPLDENIPNKPKPIDSGSGTQSPTESTIEQKPSDQFFEKYLIAVDKSKEGMNNEDVVLEAMVIGADGEVLFESANSQQIKFSVGDWEDYPGRAGTLEIYANDQEDVYTSTFLD